MAMRGQWKTFESVLAGIVLLLFVAALVSVRSGTQSSPPMQGYKALWSVYEKGQLRADAAALDTSAIDADVAATGYLLGFNHTVVICNQTSCIGSPPQADSVFASSILISGDATYEPAEVILYISG